MSEKDKWFEEYRCGCVSESVRTQRELLGYCAKHGASRRRIYPTFIDSHPNDCVGEQLRKADQSGVLPPDAQKIQPPSNTD